MSVSSGETARVFKDRRSEIRVPPTEAKCTPGGVAQRAERAHF